MKKNSLFKNQKGVSQDSIKDFSKKISAAKQACISDDFLIIARIESFILGKTLSDALTRADAYSKPGADAILIHSKEKIQNRSLILQKNFLKVNTTNLWYVYHQHILMYMKKNL